MKICRSDYCMHHAGYILSRPQYGRAVPLRVNVVLDPAVLRRELQRMMDRLLRRRRPRDLPKLAPVLGIGHVDV